jgi:hypothetical protein
MAQQSPPEPTQIKAFLNGYRQDDGKRPFFLREQTSEEKVTSVYYKEVVQAVQRVTGAQSVHIFHHQIRNAAASSGTAGWGLRMS